MDSGSSERSICAIDPIATELSENEAEIFNPRCVLVTGISLTSSGHGLKRLLASLVGRSSRVSSEMKGGKAQFIVRYNIHNYVRDGCCHILFASPAEAKDFLERVSAQPEVKFEGRALFFSFGASSLRDHFFPTLPFEVRRAMKLDPVATFSVTGEVASLRMSTALVNGFLPAVLTHFNLPCEEVLIVDATAGVGGNALGLIRSVHNAGVRANLTCVEMDELRFALLRENVLAGAPRYINSPEKIETSSINGSKSTEIKLNSLVTVNLLCGCGYEASITKANDGTGPRILFFDPPWGGPNYVERGAIEMNVNDSSGRSITLSFAEILRRLCGLSSADASPNSFHIIASKLPATYDLTRLARLVTDSEAYGKDNKLRKFPFRLHFDASMVMFVVVANPLCGHFSNLGTEQASNNFLDDLVASINDWHGKGSNYQISDETGEMGKSEDSTPSAPWGAQSFQGIGICRPEFFDFEKQRWILLKKWIPSKKRTHANAQIHKESAEV